MEHLFVDEAALLRSPAQTFTEFYTCGAESGGGRVRGVLDFPPAVRSAEKMASSSGLVATASRQASVFAARYVTFETRKGRRPVASGARLGGALRHLAGLGGPRRSAGAATHFLKNVSEQVPNPESRIVLTREHDALGMPRIELRWRLSPIDTHTVHRAHAILREDLASAGVRFTSLLGNERDPWPVRLRGGRHHMGTTRMHADPGRGVVNPDCRVHGISNLHIAGSSVFPTSGVANPTFTIVALALRLADGITAGA
jgi:choline dehydrogenase-like flavoprotein